MEKIARALLFALLLVGVTKPHSEGLTEDQGLGLCLVVGGNIAEGTINGLNDRGSIQKAKVLKKGVAWAIKDYGKDPESIIPTERQFNSVNNFFLNLDISDKRKIFANCFNAIPPERVEKLFKEVGR